MTKPFFAHHQTHIARLVQVALAAANPYTAVLHYLQRHGRSLTIGDFTHSLSQGRIFLISAGKAAIPMAQAAIEALGEAISTGIVVTKKQQHSTFNIQHSAFTLFQAGHPVSDEVSVQAATAVQTLLQNTTADDLVLCLISGGASALLARPLIPLADWQTLSQILLASGCTIQEFNTVRRQLDEVKGGGLTRWAAPTACVSLILSDVVGNPLSSIGSGPTFPGEDTPADALAILERYGVKDKVEAAVWEKIQLQVTSNKVQKANVRLVPCNLHLIVGDVRRAAQAVVDKTAEWGFTTHLLTAHLEGEAREVGRLAAALAKDMPVNTCYVLGGETTVTLHGHGRGGRNQELALAAAIALEGWPNRVIVSFATDGEDGTAPAAGAWVTGETVKYGRSLHLDPLDYLNQNDSYTYFHLLEGGGQTAVGGHLLTGPTGTNVNDLLIMMNYEI